MKTTKRPPMTLKHETVRTLSGLELNRARGGDGKTDNACTLTRELCPDPF